MTHDPELKAMSIILDALQNLDSSTRDRVVNWVMNKLKIGSDVSEQKTNSIKRGPKPGKRTSRKSGIPNKNKIRNINRGKSQGKISDTKASGSELGHKPGSAAKRSGGSTSTGARRKA